MRKRGQAVIKDKGFTAKKTLSVNDAKRLACSDKRECASLVENWDEISPLFVPVLELSDDNERVSNVNVVLRGSIYSDAKWVQASKLWDMDDPLLLKINKIDLSLFQFGNSLQSDILDHSKLEYSFHRKKGEEIDPSEIQDMGFEGFSLRAFLIPTSGVISKLLVAIYPFPEDILLESYPLAKNPKFPCISTGEMEIEMGVVASTILDDPVGSPILPGIIPGSPLATVASIPSTTELLSRLSSLLRTALLPELRSSRSALFNRYESIEEKGEDSLKSVPLEIVWPEPEPVASTQGNKQILKYFNL